jgi:hypothetical protein
MRTFVAESAVSRESTAGAARLEGHAYGLTFRILAVLLVGGATLWMLDLQRRGSIDLLDWRGSSWITLPWLMSVAFAVALWRSRSGVDGERLYQRLFWEKRVLESEIASARLIRVRGLDWLFAPRLYVRTAGHRVVALYAADPAVLDHFAGIAARVRRRP